MVLKLIIVDPSKSRRDKVRSNTFHHFRIDSLKKPRNQFGNGNIISGIREDQDRKDGCAPTIFNGFDPVRKTSPSSKIKEEICDTSEGPRKNIFETSFVTGRGQTANSKTDGAPSIKDNPGSHRVAEDSMPVNRRSSNGSDAKKKMKLIFMKLVMKQSGLPKKQRAASESLSPFEQRQHIIYFTHNKKQNNVKSLRDGHPQKASKATSVAPSEAIKKEISKDLAGSTEQVKLLPSSERNNKATNRNSKSGNETKFKFYRVDPQQPSAAKRIVKYTFKVNLKENIKRNQDSINTVK